ncbi:MAG: hypothetical protein ACOCXQ_01480 [Patescibacteria group bacterium]
MSRKRSKKIEKKSPVKNRSPKHIIYLVSAAVIILYLTSFIIRDIRHSLLFSRQDRVNIIVYDDVPTYYSFGLREVGNYALSFYPDLRAQVPGGYGYYRIGALGKLVKLEQDPDILRRTFSSITSTFVDYSFYTNSDDVYYGGEEVKKKEKRPTIQQILLMESNASLVDRLIILSLLNRIKSNTIHEISYVPYDQVKEDTIINNEQFLDKQIGAFYQKTYRDENLNVQIIYSKSRDTAHHISSLLNGNGIVVVDISQEKNDNLNCTIRTEYVDRRYQTVEFLSNFFDCDIESGRTGVYDIQFLLGGVEETWEVNYNL